MYFLERSVSLSHYSFYLRWEISCKQHQSCKWTLHILRSQYFSIIFHKKYFIFHYKKNLKEFYGLIIMDFIFADTVIFLTNTHKFLVNRRFILFWASRQVIVPKFLGYLHGKAFCIKMVTSSHVFTDTYCSR